MKKTILLTGGLGFIGSHTCVVLEQAGYKTILLDNLSNSSLAALDAIEEIIGYRPMFYDADIRDRKAISSILAANSIDAVVHFAGLKSVGESCSEPFEYYDNNLRGSIVLFEEMEHVGLRRIVFSSSATVYDASLSDSPFAENAPLGTTNPYGTTKLVLEHILKDLSTTKSWEVAALRYFNPIGAHPSGLIGERPNGIPNNLLPFVMDVATGKREKVRVFGNDYPTVDGSGVRDYIDVNDLAEAHLAAIGWLLGTEVSATSDISARGSRFEPINIGTGRGTSVLEMINIVESVTGAKVPYEICPRRAGDIGTATASVEKAREILGWEAKRTVSEAVATAYEFSKGNM